MLNYLWAFMVIAGIAYGIVTGNMDAVSDGIIEGGGEAVSLCITMLGVITMWTGIMNIAQKSGFIDGLQRRLKPVLYFLFPDVPRDSEALQYISVNMIANIFGLGWAATPAGLKAMEQLSQLDDARKKPGIATNSMCTFLIINISSLQLIPINIIAYRTQYGSASPESIIIPGIIATLASTIAAVIFCQLLRKCENNTKNY